KNVARKQRLVERHGLAPVFANAAVARQGHQNPRPLAVFGEFLLTARTRVRHVPGRLGHVRRIKEQEFRSQKAEAEDRERKRKSMEAERRRTVDGKAVNGRATSVSTRPGKAM